MPLPSHEITVEDGALGAAGPSADGIVAFVGVSATGPVNAVASYRDAKAASAVLGEGPLTDALRQYHGGEKQKTSRVVRAEADVDGAVGALAIGTVNADPGNTGDGTLAAGGSPTLTYDVDVTITTAGERGTAVFKYTLQFAADEIIGNVVPADGLFAIPNTGLMLLFTNGPGGGPASFEVGDTFSFHVQFTPNAVTEVTREGGGNVACGLTTGFDSPVNAFDFRVQIVETGELGAATFKYSLDGGDKLSEEITVPSGGTYDIPGTGVKAVFSTGDAPSFVAGDEYAFQSTAPTPSLDSINAALDALLAFNGGYEIVYIVGPSASATWAALEIRAEEFQAAKKWIRIFAEARGPAVGETLAAWVADLLDERSGLELVRVGVVAGRHEAILPGSNLQLEVNSGPLIFGRVASIPVQRSAARVADGPLTGALRLAPVGIHDGHLTDLDDAGYTTVRNIEGLEGVYVTATRLLAGPTSDYKHLEEGRTMDKGCRGVYLAGLQYLNDEFTGGKAEIASMQAGMQVPLNRMAARKPREIVSGLVVIPEGQDVLGTGELQTEVRIVPVGKIRQLTTTIAFNNPTLAA